MSNWLERSIKLVSPEWAARRAQSRYVTDVLEHATKKRHYEGASSGRRTAGWMAPGTSANTAASMALTRLRDRSRDLVRNNVFAGRAIRGIARNVVGKGIIPAPEITGKDDLEKRIKKAWNDWARKKESADFEEKKTFYGIQKLVVKSLVESGEVLVVRKRSADTEIPFKLQVLEADYIDTSKNHEESDGDRVMQGVRTTKNGVVVGYWLFNYHPGESRNYGAIESVFVPKDDILHIYREDRPGQLRGIPFGASCFIKLRDYDEYDDAQLVRQKIAACFAAFVYDHQADVLPGGSKSSTDNYEKLEPGIIEYLPPGKDVKFGTPPHVEGYREYASTTLHSIAIGFDVPYELLTGDLSEVNFSSAKMGWNEFQRTIDDIQDDILIPKLLNPIWEWFMEALIMRGQIKRGEEITTTWTPPRREMVNPKDEIAAMLERVRAGFISWSDAARSLGYDPDELLKEIKKDFDKFRELELMLTCDPRFDQARKNFGEEPTVDGAGNNDPDGAKK